ncbi:MAG: cadherin domain-containing protein [Pegethrix bostrychoides GSE-TBD4-15B]|jgi:hypothetical protein|uniref:Cadherin domain-containing protein n=1 Tax=Pegethrix bostrychoides GSE-TBD4-15B TaxID=2839662 RepID=A0A951P804_9CYAN|nr:cadherin domain-containing protein [Pegethrix bostrychoides GSE-TBD4-15B]
MPISGGSEFKVNTTIADRQTTSNTTAAGFTGNNSERPTQALAMNASGDIIVTWSGEGDDATEPAALGVYARRYDAATQTWGSEFIVNPPLSDPSIPDYEGQQIASAVALDDAGNFVITWSSNAINQPGDSANFGVYAQRYSPTGAALGTAFQVNANRLSPQADSAIAIDPSGVNGFVVTWTSQNQDGSGLGIYARRYNPDGTPQGAEVLVNTFTAGDQFHSNVAMSTDGSYVVIWESDGQIGAGTEIYGQRFNADGTKAGAEFLINGNTAGTQRNASVSMDATGNFVVTWTSVQGAFGTEVYARRYSKAGVPLGNEFNVSAPNGSGLAGTQQDSQVKVLSDGSFIITWTGEDASGTGIYARRYGANGSPLPDTEGGVAFVVNPTTAGNQTFAAVGADAAGNFAVAWTGSQDGTDDVYNRFYTVTTSPNTAPTDITLTNATTPENVAPGTVIGTLDTTDAEGGSFGYELVDAAGNLDPDSPFAIVDNGGVFELRIKASPDFETQSSYPIRIKTTDSGGLSFTKAFTIAITNLNEPPTDVAVTPSTVNENVPLGTIVGALSTIDPDVGDTFGYALIASPLGPDNAAFAISGGNLVTNAPLDFETKSSYTIYVETTDAAGNKLQKQLVISVLNVNEAPDSLVLSATNINENVPANSPIGTITGTDPDADDAASLVYSLAPGGIDNAAFSIVGNQLQINASPDFETKPSYSIVIRATDAGGLFIDRPFTITINDLPETPTNQAPTDIVLTPGTVNENVTGAGLAFGSLSSLDPNAGDTFTYSLVVGAGSIDNAAFTIVGDKLQINASPDFETKPSYSIRVRSTDQGGLNFDKIITVNVIDINEAPTDLQLTPNSISEDQPPGTLVGNLSTIDPDATESFAYVLVAGAGDTDNAAFALSADGKLTIIGQPDFETQTDYSIRVQVTDKGGLTLEKIIPISVIDVAEPGSPTDITLSATSIDENLPPNSSIGRLDSVDADSPAGPFTYSIDTTFGDAASFAIDPTNNQLLLVPSANFEAKANYLVRVITTDPGGLSFAKQFTITVNDLNEAPTALTLSATEIAENSPADSVIGSFLTTDPDAGESFTYALVAGAGDTDNTAFTIVGNSLQINAIPDFEAKSSYSVRVSTTDKGGLTLEQVFTITVRDVGETPTAINLSATSIDENQPINSVIGTLSTVDADLPNDTFTYSLVAGSGPNDNASFRIVDNQLQILAVPNFEVKPSYSVRVRSTDKDGLFVETDFIIQVNDIPEAPVAINLSSDSINENAPANSLVGSITTSDPDAGNSFTYALVAGDGSTDNDAFTLVNNNGVIELRLNAVPDFETKPSYAIRLKTTDSTGLTLEQAFTIRVIDLDEQPGTNLPTDLLLNNSQIDENRPANTVIGVFSSVDPDQNETFTYSLVAGEGSTDNAAFTIVGDRLQINAIPDFETKPSYSIRVRTTDAGNKVFEKVFTITVNDLPETPGSTTPQDLLLSNNQIAENQPANSLIGSFSTVDPDLGDSFTYSLVAGEGSTDNAAFTLVNGELQINAIPNFEVKPSYSIRVRTTDVGGLFLEKTFTVIVTDLPETPGTNAPQDLLLSSNSIEENRPVNSPIGSFSTLDPDTGDSFTYSLVAGDGSTDNAAFTIVNGELRLNVVPDFETKSSYSIRVRTTDVGGLFLEKVFTIRIIDLPENPGDTPPTDLLLSRSDIDENQPAGSTVGTLSTVDPDVGDSFTYSLVPGFGDNAAFTIVTNNGVTELRINGSPDFETKPAYTVRITTTDSGDNTFTKTLTVTVNNLNDPPIVTTSTGSLAYQEGSGAVAIDPGLAVTDIDSPDLAGGTVRLVNYIAGQDTLALAPQSGISGSFDAATGILTLTGTASLAAYQQALRSITYLNSSRNPSTTPRTVQFSVSDGTSSSNLAPRTIQITPVNSAPIVTVSAGGLSYTEDSGELSIDPGILVSDDDSPILTSAAIQLVGYLASEDRLSLTPQDGLTSNFDAARGLLIITGNAPAASYQAALRSVTYSNVSGNPNVTPRTVQFTVRDSSLTSEIASRTIQVIPVESPAVVTTSGGSLSYTENAGQVAIDPLLTAVDADSDSLTGAKVQLQGYLPGQDSLSVTLQSGISGGFDAATGILTLTGTASLAVYQTVLRSITYANSSDDPSMANRTAQFTVQNNGSSSNLASRTIQVIPVNDPPVLQASLSETSFGGGSLLVDPNLALSDLDNPTLNGATVRIGGFVASEDSLLFTSQSGITGSFNATTGVLRLSGTASAAAYQTALRSVRYSNNQPIPTGTARSITFQATDGVASSNTVAVQVQVLPSGIVPPIDLNGSDAGNDFISTFLIAGSPINIVANDARFNQVYPVFTSARVQISNPLDGASELLSVNTAGTNIVASYDASRGVLDLSGVADPGQYLQVLRTVQYQNTDIEVDGTTRSILFTLSNGSSTSEPAQTRVQISQINLDGGTGVDGAIVTTPATDLIGATGSNDTVISTLQNLRQNDVINGGAGRDRFLLTEGADPLVIDLGNPVNQVSGIVGSNTAIAGFESFQLTGYSAPVTMLGSAQDDTLFGGSSNDALYGGSGNDVLSGGSGNDFLDGGLGNDQMEGGLGDDLYVVDSPNDLVIEAANQGFDSVQSSVSYTLGNNLEALTLTGAATDGGGNALDNQITGNGKRNRLQGEAGNDILSGGGNRDVLLGGAGDDKLIGGAGRDVLFGNQGKDIFVLTAARKNSRDAIKDFSGKDDIIQVDRNGFSKSLNLGKLRASQFHLGSSAQNSSDRFIYDRSNGNLFFDADGVGGSSQVPIARLSNRTALSASEIRVVNL